MRPVIVKGMSAIWRITSSTSFTTKVPNATTHPSATPTSRNIPTQYSQTARTASHHVSIIVGMNCARPERNGNV